MGSCPVPGKKPTRVLPWEVSGRAPSKGYAPSSILLFPPFVKVKKLPNALSKHADVVKIRAGEAKWDLRVGRHGGRGTDGKGCRAG